MVDSVYKHITVTRIPIDQSCFICSSVFEESSIFKTITAKILPTQQLLIPTKSLAKGKD
jgi:hypothetical protein